MQTTYSIQPNDRITFGVLYADKDLLVVEKPAHLPTQPGKGHLDDTLLNALFVDYGKDLQNLGKARDYGLLHRLDKDTSGVLIVALKPNAYDKLREDFAARKVKKFYWAVCDSAPSTPSGVIKMPIVESRSSLQGGGHDTGRSTPKTAHIARVGKAAVTAFRVLQTSELACLIEARPVTGRLHQVRVHLDAIGCPILGDTVYGPRRVDTASPRLALHAHRVVFTHPRTGETIDIKTDWPKDLRRVLKNMMIEKPISGGATPEVSTADDSATPKPKQRARRVPPKRKPK